MTHLKPIVRRIGDEVMKTVDEGWARVVAAVQDLDEMESLPRQIADESHCRLADRHVRSASTSDVS